MDSRYYLRPGSPFAALVAVINPSSAPDRDTLAAVLMYKGGFSGWQVLLDHAERHRVAPLFANRLRQLDWMQGTACPVDPELRAKLEVALRDGAFAELSSLAELKRLSAAFGVHGVTPILLKGLALSALCFGKIGWRTNHDIDLLIQLPELALCDRVLVEMGYQRIEPATSLDDDEIVLWTQWHKDWVYVHASRRTIVELHYRLFDNARLSGMVDCSNVREIDLFGQHRMMSLHGGDLRSYLALHGLLHSWSRLKWLIDYELVRSLSAEKLGSSVAVRVADSLCDRVFARTVEQPGRVGFGRTALLVHASLNAMTGNGSGELEESRFGTTIKNLSHYLISFRPSYWLAEMRYDLADTSGDRSAIVQGRFHSLRRIGRWVLRKLGIDSARLT